MARDLSLFVHLLAMALWLGGMFAAGIWTARARRAGDAAVLAFAYGAARTLYRAVVAVAATFSIVSGAALMLITERPWLQPFPDHWLFQMQLLGAAAFLVTLLYVVPNSAKLAWLAERAAGGEGSGEFAARARRQAVAGSLVGAVLVYIVLAGSVRF